MLLSVLRKEVIATKVDMQHLGVVSLAVISGNCSAPLIDTTYPLSVPLEVNEIQLVLFRGETPSVSDVFDSVRLQKDVVIHILVDFESKLSLQSNLGRDFDFWLL